MTRLREPLARWTTLGVGGPAERFVLAGTEAELIAAVVAADDGGRALTILGGGSNVLVGDDGLAGDVVRVNTRGISVAREGDRALLTAAAGEPWDAVVDLAVREGLGGVECLAGIPGLAGAAPVQNIGAYGQELADTCVRVRAWDRRARAVVTLDREACAFAYRDSAFKRDREGRRVILDVTLALTPGATPALRYGELTRAMEGRVATLASTREAVRALRGAKGMLLDPDDADARSAGSFFTNPVVPRALADHVESIARESDPSLVMPRWPAPDGGVKLAAGWLIERAGVARGERLGRARVSTRHALALTNPGGDATAAEIVALARRVGERVRERFGVVLRPEVVALGVSDPLWE